MLSPSRGDVTPSTRPSRTPPRRRSSASSTRCSTALCCNIKSSKSRTSLSPSPSSSPRPCQIRPGLDADIKPVLSRSTTECLTESV
eukprot:7363383-Pyramimonas_sp.AAC.1